VPAPVTSGLAASAAGVEVATESGGGGAERRSRFRRICVYCGSAKGRKPSYQDAATQLGNQLVRTPPIPCKCMIHTTSSTLPSCFSSMGGEPGCASIRLSISLRCALEAHDPLLHAC
jgi:hypothetical protein